VTGYTLAANVETAKITDGAAGVTLTSNAAGASLLGNALDNTFVSGAGADSFDGAGGNDTVSYANSNNYVVVNLATNTATTGYAQGDKFVNIENVTGGAYADTITGNDAANTISGAGGADILDGGKGNDTLLGGIGDDTYLVDSVTDTVTELAGEGTADTVKASVSGYTLAANVENLTLIGNNNGTAIGNTLANILKGDDTNNTFDGGVGSVADTFYGGKGDDTFIVRNTGDYVYENDLEGNDTVQSWVNFTLADTWSTVIENLTLMGTADLNGTGNSFNNVLTGNSGKNILTDTAGGNDVLIGGAGADTLNGGAGNDYASYETALAGVTASLANTAVNTGDALGDTYTAIEGLRGSNFNDTLTGFATTATILDGGKGGDVMIGGTGNDTYYVDSIGDQIIDDPLVPTYTPPTGFVVVGTADFDKNGELDAVIYNKSAGTTQLQLITSGVAQTPTAIMAAGYWSGWTVQGITDADGDGDKDVFGTLSGYPYTVVVMNGTSVVSGVYMNGPFTADAIGTITVTSSSADYGTDTVVSSIDYTLGNGLENLTLNGAGSLSGTGNGKANVITGNTGDNTLDGGVETTAQVDMLTGGDGNDTYILRNADTVNETSTGGSNDTVEIRFAGTAYTVANYVETIRIQAGVAAGAITANGQGMTMFGNALANTLIGGALNDIIIGNGGADAMTGNGGTDFASYETATAGITASLANTALNTGDAVGDTYATIEGLKGSNYNDTLYGAAAIASFLDGGLGADKMTGGSAADTYYVDDAGDQVIEAGAGGVDIVYASLNYALTANVENLTLTGAALNGTGNDLANTITGTAGNNTLDGGVEGTAANDTLIGGKGDDTYILRNSADVVTEVTGEGNDAIEVRFASTAYTVANYVETVKIATGVAAGAITANAQGVSFTGNELANTFIGAGGNDTFDGGAGADSFTGNAGIDTVTYANATAGVSANLTTVTTGAAGDATGDSFASIENLVGSAYNDSLTGDAGDNAISGGNGIDTLTGGAGNDTLKGDTGNDILSGGLGTDTYQIGRGDGTDIVQNAHTDALADTLQFGANIDESQLWFKRNGNDLEVSIIGTTDGATVSGWYSNGQNQVANIKDASGHTLIAANVEALVAAMAAFGAPPIGQTTLDTATAQALAPVLAASWQ
jgi:Ca2+-binding RTX toxin-like protein